MRQVDENFKEVSAQRQEQIRKESFFPLSTTLNLGVESPSKAQTTLELGVQCYQKGDPEENWCAVWRNSSVVLACRISCLCKVGGRNTWHNFSLCLQC